MKKTLYLLRHGQTLFNVRKKIQGACDSPLTEEGINQAKIVRQYFKDNNITFDHAYSSTSERACDTLELVVDMPYERLKGLKEVNFGMSEGESEDLFTQRMSGHGDNHVELDWEKSADVLARVNNILKDIMDRDDHQTVLAVSHAGACTLFLTKWLDDKCRMIKMTNCCILKFEYEDKTFNFIEAIDHGF